MTAAAMTYSSTEKKRIRKSFAKRASRAERAVPARDAARVLHRVPAGGTCRRRSRKNEGLQAAFTSIFPISSHSGNARLEFVSFALGEPPFDVKECQQRGLTFASPLRAKVRLTIMDKEARQADGQGSEGAGGLHGRDPAHDHHRLVHHQRHRARHRVAAAPLAGRVLRARPRQDAQLGQAAVLGAHHSLPRLLARLRVRPQGLPVLPRRPPPQDAGDDPAEGARLHAGADPRRSSSPSTPSTSARRASSSSWCRSACAARSRKLRHHRQGRQGDRAPRTSASRSSTSATWKRRASRRSPCPTISCSAARSRTTSSIPETGEIIANANDEITETLLAKLREAGGREDPDASTPTTSTRGRTFRRPCASTRPPTRSRRASPSTA